jgi:uncharacterized protein YueI
MLEATLLCVGTFFRVISYIVIVLLMELICLKKTTVEEVLQQGIYGPLETKPDERRKFLGTLRERIIVALRKLQVGEAKIYPEVEQEMKKNPQAHLYLNGTMNYEALSKYVKLASKYKLEHTIVTNKEHDTEIGLVLAMDHAIDKEEIFITKKVKEQPKVKKSLFAKIFKK